MNKSYYIDIMAEGFTPAEDYGVMVVMKMIMVIMTNMGKQKMKTLR